MKMTAVDTLFKKKESYPPMSPSKTQAHYCLVCRDQRSLVKDVKVLPNDGCVTYQKPVIYDFKIRKLKDTNKQFIFREKI